MASKLFSQLAARIGSDSKNLDKILSGTNFLGDGTYEVTIQAVGPAVNKQGEVNDTQMQVTYQADDGKVHNERMFLYNQDKTDLGLDVRKLLAATIQNKDALAKFMQVAAADDTAALEMLTGMRLQITLGKRKGFEVRSTSTGGFAAYDVETGERLPGQDEHEELKQAQDAAIAVGHKRAYLRVLDFKATHAEANVEAFMAAADKAKKTVKPTARLGKAV